MAKIYQPTYADTDGKRRISGVWWYSAYLDGKRVRRSTKKHDKDEAERVMFRELGADRLPTAGSCTLADLSALIRQDYRLHGHRSTARLNRSLAALESYFGAEMKAEQIDTAAVLRYAGVRLDNKYARATINRELAALRRAFNLGRKQGLVLSVPEVKALKEDNTREHFVSTPEMKLLVKELPAELQSLAWTAFFTGWRKSECLSRQWKHVDLENGWLRLEGAQSKNREQRKFPLTPELRKVMEYQKRKAMDLIGKVDPDGPLFFHFDGPKAGRAIHNFDKAWRASRDRAGLSHIVFHDLRRSSIRNLVRAGVPETVAMKLSGHKTRAVFDRYDVTTDDDLKQAAEDLSAFIQPEKKSKS